jgi:hypothetical protein
VKSGKERLRKALEVPVDDQMFRFVKGKMALSMNWLRSQQKPTGSFGSDCTNAGVHALHGMTSLGGLALLEQWEFDTLDNLDKASSAPRDLVAAVNYEITNKELGTGLRGPDAWGMIWRLELLAMCYKKPAFESLRAAMKQRAIETLDDLAKNQRSDGGWAYYDFVTTGISFVTASALVAMIDAKEAGLPFDDQMIAKAVSAVASYRIEPGVYQYRPGGAEDGVGCAGRSSLCEYSLIRAGQGDLGALQKAIDNFFQYRHILEAIKGQSGTHIGEGKTAPYY